ncbi:hypothetical protein PV325_005578 [Microctonus aethiopoides]|nr:hypothetical protein PV325_005578 [Microctonus aethiopoides]
MHPELSRAVGDFVAYHDLEQNSAVLYKKSQKTLIGSIGTKYYINDLPINLLHKCHKVGGPYLAISPHDSHRATDHPEPAEDVIKRFENCGDLSPLSENLPSSSKKPRLSKSDKCKKNIKKVNKREINSIYHNTTKIRKRREEPEHFYLEILLFVPHSIVTHHKNVVLESYLLGVLIFHLVYFNSIDMAYAKLQTNDLNIHINLAGIIIEDDRGAFDAVIDYTRYVTKPHVGELFHNRFLRYLEYYDLPFERDSIDMIYLTTESLIQSEYIKGLVLGLTWNKIDRYRTRQIYKRSDIVPLATAIYTFKLFEFCVGAHEIGHALGIPHDTQNEEVKKGHQCHSLMQEHAPHCFNCMNLSPESINRLQEITRFDKNRCFLLNYPRSLNPPGPRVTLSPCRQCQYVG